MAAEAKKNENVEITEKSGYQDKNTATNKQNPVPGAHDLAATILLAEDSNLNSTMERNYLSSVGFHVLSASTPAQLEQILSNHRVDLLVIDVSFAGGKGLKIVSEVKRRNADKVMKIMVTSVLANPALKKQSQEAGADEFLEKPTPRPKLLRELKKLTAQSPRDNERIIQKLQVLASLNGAHVKFETLDVSSDGMHLGLGQDAVLNSAMFPIGASINLEVKIGKNDKPLSVAGIVVRHTAQGIGVRFTELGRQQRRLLDRFLIKSSLELKATQFYL